MCNNLAIHLPVQYRSFFGGSAVRVRWFRVAPACRCSRCAAIALLGPLLAQPSTAHLAAREQHHTDAQLRGTARPCHPSSGAAACSAAFASFASSSLRAFSSIVRRRTCRPFSRRSASFFFARSSSNGTFLVKASVRSAVSTASAFWNW
eukprot:EG_transcript_42846